ncbi:ADP-ribose pyrophosphatase [uncultured archaeon]|nr:ADP-ribose pyrophosphatase [uncultured archaeon]
MAKKIIPGKLYARIRMSIPIFYVNAIIRTRDGVLLGKRNNEPAKGKIWYIRGRVWLGETPERAVLRKVKEETGLNARVSDFVGLYSTVFKDDKTTQTMNAVYVVDAIGGRLQMDRRHSEFVFLKSIGRNLHPYIKRTLSDSKVFAGKRRVEKGRRKTYAFVIKQG